MRSTVKRLVPCAALVTGLLLLSGCESIPSVKPWQKGNLAKPEMNFEYDPLEGAYANHIYFSKEAASGGYGIGGGGCGCN